MKILKYILVLLLLTGTANAQTTDAGDLTGTTACPWLKIAVGARAAGMGEAYTAICDDASAIFWNPGNLMRIRKTQFFAQYSMWLIDSGHQAASFAVPIGGKNRTGSITGAIPPPIPETAFYDPSFYYMGFNAFAPAGGYEEPDAPLPTPAGVFAIGVTALTSGEITSTDESGNPGAAVTMMSYAAIASFCQSVGDNIGLGLNVKMINETIADDISSTYALDAGISLSAGGIRLGGAIQNLGGSIKDLELPRVIRAGASMILGPITVSGDYVMPNDHAPYMSAGGEFSLGGALSARAGMIIGLDDFGSGSSNLVPEGFTAGVGLGGNNLSIDAAIVPYGDLGETYRASMKMSF